MPEPPTPDCSPPLPSAFADAPRAGHPGRGPSPRALLRAANDLLASLHSGSMSETSYDTAWVARVRDPRDPGQPHFPSAVDWLLRHQHDDGSWGGRVPIVHDRVMSTLSAVLALAEWPVKGHAAAVARGVAYLANAIPRLQDDFVETVGFELILPTLLLRARQLGLALPYEHAGAIERLRADKLRRLPTGFVYSGPSSLTYSLEFFGTQLRPDLARRCRAPNGSYGASPSATAFVLTQQWDEDSAGYLRAVLSLSDDGGACNVFPSEVFEKGMVLHHLQPLAGRLTAHRPHVAALAAAWSPAGVGGTVQGLVPDGDDTAIVLRVLHDHGLPIPSRVLSLFEADDCFLTYPLERNSSVSTNAHVLYALKDCPPFAERQRMLSKALSFLAATRTDRRYWRDKWHASPYFATGHAIVALAGLGQLADRLVDDAVDWLTETQLPNGSWSAFVADGTSEETAYALRALAASQRSAPGIRSAAARAAAYLWQQFDRVDAPELWVAKSLYTPHAIVRAAILGALESYHQMRAGA